MIERHPFTPLKAAALAISVLGAGVMPTTAATPCQPLPAGFELCDADLTVAIETVAFEGDETIAMAQIGATWAEIIALPGGPADQTAEDVLSEILAANLAQDTADGLAAPEVVNRHRYATETLQVAALTLSEQDGGAKYLFCISVLQGDTGQLALFLDGDDTLDAAALEALAERITHAIRPVRGG